MGAKRVFSEEHRHNLSVALKGKRFTAERRQGLSEAQKCKWADPEYHKRMSEAHRGKPSSQKGTHRSEAIKQKLREAALAAYESDPTIAEKLSAASKAQWADPKVAEKMRAHLGQIQRERRGTHHSEETKQKISRSSSTEEMRRIYSEYAKARWSDPEYKDRVMRAVGKGSQGRPTKPEQHTRDILDRYFPGEWKYTGDGEVIIGGKNPDFTNVNGQKAVVEVFGDWWHSERKTGRSAEQEIARRVAHFAQYGFRCVVIWEREVADERLVAERVAAMERA